MYLIFFIYPPLVGHLGCFDVLVIVNSVAINIVVHVVLNYVFSGYMPKSWIAGSNGSSVFNLFVCYFNFTSFKIFSNLFSVQFSRSVMSDSLRPH